ncbi:MAG: DUF4097 domain-containing protein [Cyclobacteriaceae bacterium]
MTIRRISVVLLLASLAMPLAVLAQKEASNTFKGIKRIRMSTGSGDVNIEKSNDANVSVQVTYTYDPNNYEPKMEQVGDRLEIQEVFKSKNSGRGESQWSLKIPDGLGVRFTTGSGNINISDLQIELTAVTGSGDITFSNLTGEIKSTTGSGDIELNRVKGELQATTGSGSITADSSSGEMSLTCGSGNIRLDNSQAAFKVATGSGDIRGRQIATTGASSFATGSGDATLALSASPAADLSVASGSGDAEVDFGGNVIQGEIIMKANKHNGDIVAPFEFDNVEEIEMGDDTVIKKTVVRGSADKRISISTGSGSAVLRQ